MPWANGSARTSDRLVGANEHTWKATTKQRTLRRRVRRASPIADLLVTARTPPSSVRWRFRPPACRPLVSREPTCPFPEAGIARVPASARRSCVGSPQGASLRRHSDGPRRPVRLPRAAIRGLRPLFSQRLSGSRSVDHGRTSPAGVVAVHRCRSSCRERRRPWPQAIDPAQDVGEQRTRHRNLGQLETSIYRRFGGIGVGAAVTRRVRSRSWWAARRPGGGQHSADRRSFR